MHTRLFIPSEIAHYFRGGELKEDLLLGETIAICSIADLISLCEEHKKGNLNIPLMYLRERFALFNDSPIKEGRVWIADLDQDTLSSKLFDKDDEGIVELWPVAANRLIEPKHSIKSLTLRIDDLCWWASEDIYQEITEYQITQVSND